MPYQGGLFKLKVWLYLGNFKYIHRSAIILGPSKSIWAIK